MKLTVLGGGGVRAPILARSIAWKAKELNLHDVVFMDNDPVRLSIYGQLAKHVIARIYPELHFEITDNACDALKKADYIITTIRAGQDEARILDEKIALRHGVLGQETTGAGGFSMAMRSIPVLITYCDMIQKYANPDALVLNFTNPSGLVTQALRNKGYANVIGICDGPIELIGDLAKISGCSVQDLDIECFGLNHLSWFRSVRKNNIELLPSLISNPDLYSHTSMRLFDPEIIKTLQMVFSSYLFYYYHREIAVANIIKSGKTRGEQIALINSNMQNELAGLNIAKDPSRALQSYFSYLHEREQSYMSVEAGARGVHERTIDIEEQINNKQSDGYAGVALNLVAAYQSDTTDRKPFTMIASVPNNGAISGLRDDDVVEITCHVNGKKVEPIKIGEVPDLQKHLILQVKLFERYAASAILHKDVQQAKLALMIHPLVNSYSIANDLVNEYIAANKLYAGDWHL